MATISSKYFLTALTSACIFLCAEAHAMQPDRNGEETVTKRSKFSSAQEDEDRLNEQRRIEEQNLLQEIKHVADTWLYYKGTPLEVDASNVKNIKIWLEQDGYF